MMNWAGQCVWITGAGKGIGRAVALKMAAAGAIVAASARTPADLRSLEEEAKGLAGRICAYPLDVTHEEAVAGTLGRIEEELGPIDCAILNAGTHSAIRAAELQVRPFRDLMETNFMGTVNSLVPLVERMKERRSGRIGIVASLAGYRGLPTAAGYGASKAALINMAEALYPELERQGIVIQLIDPGFVATPLTDRNEFDMPFLISAEEAAERICNGLKGRSFEIAFPRRFAFLMKLLRILPDFLFFAITRRLLPDSE